MPDYKHRWIELTPRRDTNDGTWRCPYMIIEFRQTCWGYCRGYPDGIFASSRDATAAALEEAKRLIDSLEGLAQSPRSESDSVLGTYASRIGRLFAWSG